MNFGELIEATGHRAGMDSRDPWYSRLGEECVMPAIRELEFFNPRGWDWLWQDLSFTLTSGDAEVAFSELESSLDPSGVTLVRIHALSADPAGTGIYDPLPRYNRLDLEQLRLVPSAPTFPAAWTVEGQALIVAPTPGADVPLKARVIVSERDLQLTEEPITPERYHGVIIDLARAYVFEMKADEERAAAARARAETTLRRAMAHSRAWGGPASTPLEG